MNVKNEKDSRETCFIHEVVKYDMIYLDKSMFAEKQGFSQKRHSCSGKACNRPNLLHRKVPGLI